MNVKLRFPELRMDKDGKPILIEKRINMAQLKLTFLNGQNEDKVIRPNPANEPVAELFRFHVEAPGIEDLFVKEVQLPTLKSDIAGPAEAVLVMYVPEEKMTGKGACAFPPPRKRRQGRPHRQSQKDKVK